MNSIEHQRALGAYIDALDKWQTEKKLYGSVSRATADELTRAANALTELENAVFLGKGRPALKLIPGGKK